MDDYLTAVYTEKYNLMKKLIKAQKILIVTLTITAMISVFYNMRLTTNIEELKNQIEVCNYGN